MQHYRQKPRTTIAQHIANTFFYVSILACFFALEFYNLGAPNWPKAFFAANTIASLDTLLRATGHRNTAVTINWTIILGSVFHFLFNLLFA